MNTHTHTQREATTCEAHKRVKHKRVKHKRVCVNMMEIILMPEI